MGGVRGRPGLVWRFRSPESVSVAGEHGCASVALTLRWVSLRSMWCASSASYICGVLACWMLRSLMFACGGGHRVIGAP
eukprot:9152293-Alexandrium_andersonii.AAC.1